jgi:EAL domain-containing protein (putative c-di-GMP-specific phosphodiesterase class I)
LGHRLGKRVVAEGIETAEQLRALRELGCDIAQGYHLARPAPADVLVESGALGPARRQAGQATARPVA